MPARKKFHPAGEFWLIGQGENVLNESRIALLEQIAATGSLTQAGKAIGVSYRTAWLALDHLNGLAERPLVETAAGGTHGGGSRLTAQGSDLVALYRTLQAEHAKYLARMRESVRDFDAFLRLTRKIALKTSARNQLFGTVESIVRDGLQARVAMRLKGQDLLVSQITRGGLDSLGLKKGDQAYVLIKANWISLSEGKALAVGKALENSKGRKIPAARAELTRTGKAQSLNRLQGEIIALEKNRSGAEVTLRLPGGSDLIASIPLKGSSGSYLREGRMAEASFRASDVILGVA